MTVYNVGLPSSSGSLLPPSRIAGDTGSWKHDDTLRGITDDCWWQVKHESRCVKRMLVTLSIVHCLYANGGLPHLRPYTCTMCMRMYASELTRLWHARCCAVAFNSRQYIAAVVMSLAMFNALLAIHSPYADTVRACPTPSLIITPMPHQRHTNQCHAIKGVCLSRSLNLGTVVGIRTQSCVTPYVL